MQYIITYYDTSGSRHIVDHGVSHMNKILLTSYKTIECLFNYCVLSVTSCLSHFLSVSPAVYHTFFLCHQLSISLPVTCNVSPAVHDIMSVEGEYHYKRSQVMDKLKTVVRTRNTLFPKQHTCTFT